MPQIELNQSFLQTKLLIELSRKFIQLDLSSNNPKTKRLGHPKHNL